MSLKLFLYSGKQKRNFFFNRIVYALSRNIVVLKKVDKRHKTLNVSSKDFQNAIELLK